MGSVNYDVLNEKTQGFDNFSIGDKYIWGKRTITALTIGDKNKLEKIIKKTGLESLYCDAVEFIFDQIAKGMTIVPESNKRIISLLFKDSKKDMSGDFFEIVSLANKLSSDKLERMVIIGYFMDEERMNIIQSYQLLTGKVL